MRKHQSLEFLLLCEGNLLMTSPHKELVMQKVFPCLEVIMKCHETRKGCSIFSWYAQLFTGTKRIDWTTETNWNRPRGFMFRNDPRLNQLFIYSFLENIHIYIYFIYYSTLKWGWVDVCLHWSFPHHDVIMKCPEARKGCSFFSWYGQMFTGTKRINWTTETSWNRPEAFNFRNDPELQTELTMYLLFIYIYIYRERE